MEQALTNNLLLSLLQFCWSPRNFCRHFCCSAAISAWSKAKKQPDSNILWSLCVREDFFPCYILIEKEWYCTTSLDLGNLSAHSAQPKPIQSTHPHVEIFRNHLRAGKWESNNFLTCKDVAVHKVNCKNSSSLSNVLLLGFSRLGTWAAWTLYHFYHGTS